MIKEDVVKYLRKLAKSGYYQTLYSNAKEIHLKIFENDYNLTELQICFLHYLSFYSSLFVDYALGEVSELVFESQTYEDAYQTYKTSSRKKDNEPVIQNPANKNTKETINLESSTWIFKKPKK